MTRRSICLPFLSAVLFTLAACDGTPKERHVPNLPDVKANLDFTCAYEKDAIPPRDPEADQLYVHARWLGKNNLLKKDPMVYPVIERLIRISTAYGHDKANLELRQMMAQGQAGSYDIVGETLDLTQDLIDRGIPGGYYDMARYLDVGYGVKKDPDLALGYYRKSADLGNPEGQYAVGDLLTGANDEAVKEIGIQMWRCAAEQGHGGAGLELGIRFKNLKRYPEAMQTFQLGAKAGNDLAAGRLRRAFDNPPPNDDMFYLDLKKDEERAKRYYAISDFLSSYSYLNPKVPEIDSIVPLPPAKLPKWDGTFQWFKAHEANVPPPLPAEERIREMAKAKGLDPETGCPLKAKKAKTTEPAPVKVTALAVPSVPIGTILASGVRCPQSGTWQCAEHQAIGGDRRFFTAGETLPTVLVPVERGLLQKLHGNAENRLTETAWTLVAYPEKNT